MFEESLGSSSIAVQSQYYRDGDEENGFLEYPKCNEVGKTRERERELHSLRNCRSHGRKMELKKRRKSHGDGELNCCCSRLELLT